MSRIEEKKKMYPINLGMDYKEAKILLNVLRFRLKGIDDVLEKINKSTKLSVEECAEMRKTLYDEKLIIKDLIEELNSIDL